jgi:hypothetical protein
LFEVEIENVYLEHREPRFGLGEETSGWSLGVLGFGLDLGGIEDELQPPRT